MPLSIRVQLGAALSAPQVVPDFPAMQRLIARAARAALRHEQIAHAEVSVTLLDDAEIADLNNRFLDHDAPTDVISFPLYDAGEVPIGDIYIGWLQARRQAEQERIPELEELARLTVHGVLHVLGHDHADGAERLESEMWQTQEAIVNRVRLA